MVKKTALHRIGEDAAQTGVQALDGAFGERFSIDEILLLTHLHVKFAEMLRTQFGELVLSQSGDDPGDIPFLAGR